jgi:hypothetical protein
MSRLSLGVLLLVGVFFVGAYPSLTTPASAQAAKPTARTLNQTELDEVIRVYCQAWSEPDIERRRQLLTRVWATEGTYTDPSSHVEGREALVNHMSGLHQRSPGNRIVPTSHAEMHHGGLLRFTWRSIGGDGKIRVEGIDFAELTSDGLLSRIVGFNGPLKPLE